MMKKTIKKWILGLLLSGFIFPLYSLEQDFSNSNERVKEKVNNKLIRKAKFKVKPFFKKGYEFTLIPSFTYKYQTKYNIDLNFTLDYLHAVFQYTPLKEGFDRISTGFEILHYPVERLYYGVGITEYYFSPNSSFKNLLKNFGLAQNSERISALEFKIGYKLTEIKFKLKFLNNKQWSFPLVFETSYVSSENYNYQVNFQDAGNRYEIKEGMNYRLRTRIRF